MSRRSLLAASAIASALVVGPAFAELASPQSELFDSRMHEGLTRALFLESLERDLRELATGGGDVLRADHLSELGMMTAARNRAKGAANIMDKDLDGDGFATEPEIRKVLTFEQGLLSGLAPDLDERREKKIKEYLAVDANGDGRIDWAEATAQAARVDAEERAKKGGGKREWMLALDPNGDFALTLTEYQAAGEAVFKSADADGDGKLSRAEAEVYRSHGAAPAKSSETPKVSARPLVANITPPLAAALSEAQSIGCAMPPPSARAEIAVVSLAEAEALSSAAVATQDQPMETVELAIEPGDTPLYVVALSRAGMIWRVTGATSRVERLVVGSNTGLAQGDAATSVPLVGESGLPSERALFLANTGCVFAFTETPSIAAARAVAIIRARLGKEPAVVAAENSAGSFSVPSGKTRSIAERSGLPTVVLPGGKVRFKSAPESMTLTAGADDPATDLGRNYPEGVVDVEVDSVASPLPVTAYEVLPREAGLLQLLKSGAVTRDKSGDYLVRKKMRFPAGLCADHAVTFLLMRGVPEPEGDPCDAKLISEESGLSLSPG